MSSKNGMFYYKATPTDLKEGVWWEEHCIRRQGGYDLLTTNLPAGFRWLLKGTVLAFDSGTGKAKVLKTAKVYADAAINATSLQVVDTGILKVGDTIGGSTISAISVSEGVATLTVGALAAAISKDTVLAESLEGVKLLGLAYETTDLQDNTYPQVTPTLQAFEIEEDTLPYPINSDVKTALGALHQFKIQ